MRNTLRDEEIKDAVDELESFALRLADEFWAENHERRKTSEAGILAQISHGRPNARLLAA